MNSFNFDNLSNNSYSEVFDKMNENIQRGMEINQRKINEKLEYDEAVLNTLNEIKNNTASLTQIMELIKDSNDKQDEVLEIVIDFISLSKSKNKNEAESKFRKIMNKIENVTTDIDTMIKLYAFGTSIHAVLTASGVM